MSAAPSLDWTWQARHNIPEAQAAVAWKQAAVALLQRVGQLEPPQQARLALTANRDVVVVAGNAADLPWVEGIAYAAPCQDAPALWLPVLWEPDIPMDLLARSVARRHPRQPLLLWPTPAALLPLDRLLPVTTTLLAHVHAHWQRG